METVFTPIEARLLPSLMCMPLIEVKNDLEVLGEFFDEVHIDIMDGHFCESIHLSPSYVQEIRPIWNGAIDVHLMVDKPGQYLDELLAAGADSIVFHLEATPTSVNRLIEKVRSAGARVGVAVCPSTPIQNIDDLLSRIDRVTILGVDPGYIGQSMLPSTLRRVRYVTDACKSLGSKCDVCVDGGVRWENWDSLALAGADSLVVGRGALFDRGATIRDACIATTAAFHARVV